MSKPAEAVKPKLKNISLTEKELFIIHYILKQIDKSFHMTEDGYYYTDDNLMLAADQDSMFNFHEILNKVEALIK